MATHLTVTWLEALVAGFVGALAWFQVRRMPVSYLRDYLADLTWTPAFCLAIWACLAGDPGTALISTLFIAPFAALRNVAFALAFRNPPNDPSAIPEDVKRERDALRARFSPPSKGSDAPNG